MDLEKVMRTYRKETEIKAEEEGILDTVCRAKEAFYRGEEEKMLTYWEFLQTQFRMTRKRWWLFQIILLAASEIVFSAVQEEYYIRRGLGVIGVLFIVLVIPELWKNRTYHCMEVESASFYSLRQIYAARIFLFGMADVFFLTVFCGSLQKNLYLTMVDILVQFLFPIVVTACICFGTLCSRRFSNEITSIVLCLLWSAVWCMVTVSEEIYTSVVLQVWVCLFGGAILFLLFVIYKTLHNCSKSLEMEEFYGIKNN